MATSTMNLNQSPALPELHAQVQAMLSGKDSLGRLLAAMKVSPNVRNQTFSGTYTVCEPGMRAKRRLVVRLRGTDDTTTIVEVDERGEMKLENNRYHGTGDLGEHAERVLAGLAHLREQLAVAEL